MSNELWNMPILFKKLIAFLIKITLITFILKLGKTLKFLKQCPLYSFFGFLLNLFPPNLPPGRLFPGPSFFLKYRPPWLFFFWKFPFFWFPLFWFPSFLFWFFSPLDWPFPAILFFAPFKGLTVSKTSIWRFPNSLLFSFSIFYGKENFD